jgi:hypothetical protein
LKSGAKHNKDILSKEYKISIHLSKIMLYRRSDGKLIELNIYNFINDKLYYEKVIEIKRSTPPKLEKTFDYKNNQQSNK